MPPKLLLPLLASCLHTKHLPTHHPRRTHRHLGDNNLSPGGQDRIPHFPPFPSLAGIWDGKNRSACLCRLQMREVERRRLATHLPLHISLSPYPLHACLVASLYGDPVRKDIPHSAFIGQELSDRQQLHAFCSWQLPPGRRRIPQHTCLTCLPAAFFPFPCHPPHFGRKEGRHTQAGAVCLGPTCLTCLLFPLQTGS